VSLLHEPAGFPDAELRKERNVLRSAAISTQPFQKQTYRRIAKFVFGQFNRREARTKATKPGIVVETHQRAKSSEQLIPISSAALIKPTVIR
jgi:hypothetical protein